MLGQFWITLLCWLAHAFRAVNLRFSHQRGASTTEFIVAALALIPLSLGGIQGALIYNAKSVLNQATFEAARIGAVNHAQSGPMREELARRLTSFYGASSSGYEFEKAYFRAIEDIKKPAVPSPSSGSGTQLSILNPTQEAFEDFGVTVNDQLQIPNDNLRHRSTDIGPTSQVNVQDANLLKIQVTYGYRLFVPIAGEAIGAILATVDPANANYYQADPPRLPIVSTAVVRMQSAAYPDNNISIGGTGGGGVIGEGLPDEDTGGSDPGGDEDLPPGFSEGEDDSDIGVDPPEGGPVEVVEEEDSGPECEGSPYAEGDGWWSESVAALKNTGNFLVGILDGLVQQLEDLWGVISDLPGTYDALVKLVQALIEDPGKTANAIIDAFAEDVDKLVECGPYDQGKVLGEYVSPGVLLKLGSKLAKFGGNLDVAIKATKKDLGCASFVAGTPVWTTQGTVPIETLVEGATVSSRFDSSYDDVDRPVTSTFHRIAPAYLRLYTENTVVEITEEHPVWVQGLGWNPAVHLEEGDVIATADGDEQLLLIQRFDTPVRVYNFSVLDAESYFVGDSGLWVHNAKSIKCHGGDLAGVPGTLRDNFEAEATKVINGKEVFEINIGGKKFPNIPKGFQAHHIIPSSLVKDKELKKFFEKIKKLDFYDINRTNNGILLPKNKDVAIKEEVSNLPYHSGKHTKEYNNYVKKKLLDLEKEMEKGKMSAADVMDAMGKIEDEIREDIMTGKIHLNSKSHVSDI